MKPAWLVGHTWSLGIEEQFYLFWPALFVLAGIRRARVIALGLIVGMPILRVALYFLLPSARPGLIVDIHSCADRLMYGSLLALLDGEPRLERFFSRPSSLVSVILLLAFALIVDPFMQQKFRGGYALTLGLSLVSLSFVFAIAWLLRRPASLPARGLNLPLVAGVGTLSYSLYLWQQPFMWPPNSSISGRFPTDLLFVVAAASASYFLVEKPFMRLRQRFRPL